MWYRQYGWKDSLKAPEFYLAYRHEQLVVRFWRLERVSPLCFDRKCLESAQLFVLTEYAWKAHVYESTHGM